MRRAVSSSTVHRHEHLSLLYSDFWRRTSDIFCAYFGQNRYGEGTRWIFLTFLRSKLDRHGRIQDYKLRLSAFFSILSVNARTREQREARALVVWLVLVLEPNVGAFFVV
ncbi:unnamed protein product [Ectocarpus sp. 6 AP-2014]